MELKSVTIHGEAKTIAEEILNLSWRISEHSAPMKPFVRFGASGSRDPSKEQRKHFRLDLWDFDYRLQKILLGMLLEAVTPDEIPRLCEDRWKKNLDDFAHVRMSEYERAVATGTGYPYTAAGRLPSIFNELGPNRTFLYVGCGAGEECIWLAQGAIHGHRHRHKPKTC